MKGIELSDVKQKDNPLFSCTTSPWAMVAMDGLFINLYEASCHQCSSTLFVREYVASKVALLWAVTEDLASKEKSRNLLKYDPLELLPHLAKCEGLIVNPCKLVKIQSNLPDFVKTFIHKSETSLKHPFAKHKAKVAKDKSSFMANYCKCGNELFAAKNNFASTLSVMNDSGERKFLPIPIISQIN